MEFSSEKGSMFKTTWKIHNFTMVPYKAGEPLWSPTIVIGIFGGSDWKLGLYLKGYKDENYVTGIVYRGKSEKGDETIPVSLEISFKNIDGSNSKLYEKRYDFDRNNGHGFHLILKSEIFQNKKFLFPGNTLIMECRMWKSNIDTRSLSSCVRNYAFDSKFTTKNALDAMQKVLHPEVSECQIRTRINVQKLEYIWAIPRFSTIKSDQKLTVPIYSAGNNSPNFVLSISPNLSIKKSEETMHIKLSAESTESFYCSYEILLVDSDYVSRIHMKGEHLFEIGKSMSCNVPNSLKWSEIQRNKHLRLVEETLTLYCKFAVASPSSIKSFIDVTTYSPPNCGVLNLKRDEEDEKPNDPIMERNKERKFCDVSLQVDGKLLRTHKIILCTWSSVFKTFLEQDLSEDCDILNIDDYDAETIDRMLYYMYAQTVEDLDWADTAKLYFAANEYKVIELQEHCFRKLESIISISNACDLLSLADKNQNAELMRFTTGFINEHKDEVLRTEEWGKLMENRGALAAKLMHEMFVKD